MRVRRARLLCQRTDACEHLLARDPRALAVLIEHAEPRRFSIALGRKRPGALAQFGSVRARFALCVFGAGDLRARSSEFRLEPLALGVAAKLLGFGTFEASFVLARSPRVCDQLLDQRTNAA